MGIPIHILFFPCCQGRCILDFSVCHKHEGRHHFGNFPELYNAIVTILVSEILLVYRPVKFQRLLL